MVLDITCVAGIPEPLRDVSSNMAGCEIASDGECVVFVAWRLMTPLCINLIRRTQDSRGCGFAGGRLIDVELIVLVPVGEQRHLDDEI